MKKAIFTCLFGQYDELHQAPSFEGWECILFTDKKQKAMKGWDVRLVETTSSPELESRRYKWLSHLYLNEYDLVCYIDANMVLNSEPPSNPLWYVHPRRRRVSEELKKCIELGKISQNEVTRTAGFFREKRFRDNAGLFQNGFFVREHNVRMNNLCAVNWALIQKLTTRDQITFPYAVELYQMQPQGLQRFPVKSPYRLTGHLKKVKKHYAKVHHITPASTDKDFGKAINQLIEGMPEHDWICLRDIDSVPAWHEKFIQQVEELANGDHGYDLIGCMTNRLGLPYQLVEGMFDNWDILAHRAKAKEIADNAKIKPLNATQTVGGVMMLFSKKTWLRAGKFPEGGIRIDGKFIDYHFSKAVAKFGKLGIAEGVYVLHLYRIEAENTRQATGHLI